MAEYWKYVVAATDFLADVGTIAASGIAVWIFLAKRSELRTLIGAITNFVQQSSLAELRYKIEALGDLNAADPEQRLEIVSIFHDISGHIDGNPVLKNRLADISCRLRQANGGRRPLTEPHKRSLVSELRELLRHLDVKDYAEVMKDIHK